MCLCVVVCVVVVCVHVCVCVEGGRDQVWVRARGGRLLGLKVFVLEGVGLQTVKTQPSFCRQSTRREQRHRD